MKPTNNLRIEMHPYPHLRDDDGCVLANDYIHDEKMAFILEAVKEKLAKLDKSGIKMSERLEVIFSTKDAGEIDRRFAQNPVMARTVLIDMLKGVELHVGDKIEVVQYGSRED